MSLTDNKNESERLKTVPAFLFLKIFLKLLLTPSLLCVILSLRLNKIEKFVVFLSQNLSFYHNIYGAIILSKEIALFRIK